MVAPPDTEAAAAAIDLNSVLKSKMQTMPLKTAVTEIVKAYGLNKTKCTDWRLRLK